MKKYTHLVFDIDGTLIDSAPVNMQSLQETLKDLRGEVIPLEDLVFSFGIPGVATMEKLGFSDPMAATQEWIRHYDVYAEKLGMPLFQGIREVIAELQKKGIHLGVITSKLQEEYDAHFTRNGMRNYFETVITSSDTEKGKPAPDPMLAYLEKTGAAREEVLYFGDTCYDMECARSAGVDQALVLWGCLRPEGIESTYQVEKVEDILSFADFDAVKAE
ncbi:HAD family hydrolase [Anaerosacchariphilus sp. NSJ-68]|uniref:HAD family hydrolase n=2 Tax=Lachnospiraceae TaxID=186803 RepID=A0A923RN70_9FIRM|nr:MULTISPECIES: HAD family hydrolase [Lachnospiraceae]MBC5660191.1 HAD family hydrolase [Anaerosacchariphilus hominis]MBC5699306.1 HAD family hydrolase [Roseburia difficilis]